MIGSNYMKYISFYDTVKNRRSMSLAAVNKINYICSVLNRLGHHVDIISCGMVANENFQSSTEKLHEDTDVHYFKTRKQSNRKIIRIYNYIMQNLILFFYLLKNAKKNETIFVYHSLGLMRCVYLAKKIKRFKMILEVEEFYNDVKLRSKYSKKMEEKFIVCADKYIFPTILLNEKFNTDNKPYTIIHGTYQVEENRNISFNDNKIHVVYAGTFDFIKGGAYVAVSSAEYLDSRYHLHILGFGNDVDKKNILSLIDEVSNKSSACITFDGLLVGDEYTQFLQKCHIGLSTQNPNADFNDTSFPSKILSYMANGLRVVTVAIPVVKTSDVRNELYYYNNQSPKDIAEAIMKIDFNDNYDSRKIIKHLDIKFTGELEKLIGDI